MTRNPMYLGFGLVIAGVAVPLGPVVPLVITALFFPIADRLFLRREGAALTAAFGPRWQTHSRRVRR